MRTLRIDFETFSKLDVGDVGAPRYAEDDSTEILCACYKWSDDDTVYCWVPMESWEFPEAARPSEYVSDHKVVLLVQSEVPTELREHIERGDPVSAFGAQFEYLVENCKPGQKLGLPPLKIEQLRCTAAKMSVHGLPGNLGDAAQACGTHPKNEEGRAVMLQLCRPRKPSKHNPATRWTIDAVPHKFKQLFEYCVDDVLAEEGLDAFVPDLTAAELRIYQLDRRINDRGIKVDLPLVADMQSLVREYQAELKEKFVSITGLNPTQGAKFKEWIATKGYAVEDLTADTVRKILKDPLECPPIVQEALRIYSAYGAKAVSKLQPIVDAVCADGRLRGIYKYYGAGPGRWSSIIVQMQNLFRPVLSKAGVKLALEVIRTRNLDMIKFLWDEHDPIKVIASCMRSLFIAEECNTLQALDFKGIESRLVAWIFDEKWKLDAFVKQDTEGGPDNYVGAVSKIARKPISEVTAEERQAIGKTTELSFAFEGGVAAILNMCETYNVDVNKLAEMARPGIPADTWQRTERAWERAVEKNLTHELSEFVYRVLDALKLLWRAAHPRTVSGWAELKAAAADAVQNPGIVFQIKSGKIKFKVDRDWLYMKLPSGRRVAYFRPRVDGEIEDDGRHVYDNRVVSYMGIHTKTRQWCRVSTYGGRWTQNISEGIGRDLLVKGMFALEDVGYDIIGHTHDESLSECHKNFGSLKHGEELMIAREPWMHGLPVAAEGFREPRYRK